MTSSEKALDNFASDMEKELSSNLDQESSGARMPQAAQLKPVERREMTANEQFIKMEHIERQLRERVRREQLAMQHEYELKAVSIRNEYERRIAEAITALEKQRSAELAVLADDYDAHIREHQLLTKRMDRNARS